MYEIRRRFVMGYVIGIDFDNTIVRYDRVIYDAALERGLIAYTTPRSKRTVRDHIRKLHDGENEWQRLQSWVYSDGLERASLYEGFAEFARTAREAGARLFVISHKTERARFAPEQNLRELALSWMSRQGFFDRNGLGFARDEIFFHDDRLAKISRITGVGCTHFIDDLVEVLTEPSFPRSVDRMLFAPHDAAAQLDGVTAFSSWAGITRGLFR